MPRVFHFDSAPETYHSDAAVLTCFDHRFDRVIREFLSQNGISAPDIIQIAGGAKSLVSPNLESDREFALEQIRTATRLHRAEQVILAVHSDCGAYGGL